MKRILSIFFFLAFTAGIKIIAQSDYDWRIHPDSANYKIYGTYQTTFPDENTENYELTDVKPIGLQFPIKQLYLGDINAKGLVYFTFDKVKSSGKPDYQNIALWIWDDRNQKWQPDNETGQNSGTSTSAKDMIITLVLDCSSSLGETGFANVKEAAKTFVRTMLNASDKGNIHIGIVGFSSIEETKRYPLQPLTQSSAYQMLNFIDYKLVQGKGTALWTAYDFAVHSSKDYAENKLNKNNYEGTAIISFTDGIDNNSRNSKKRIGDSRSYYNYINNDVMNKKINGRDFMSFTVFQSGPDIKDPDRKNETIEQLRTVGWTHFYNITNITELNYQFKTIANYLLDSWKVLNCFLSPGIKGRVCWTFGKKVPIYRTPQTQPTPQPRQEAKRQVFVGINGGVGIPFSFFDYISMGLNAKFGVDFAFPISDRFAMGAYTSLGGGLIFEEFDELSGLGHFNVGLLMLCGDMNRPLLIGVSPGTGVVFANMARAVPLELRFGRIKKDHFYVTWDFLIGPDFGSEGIYFEPRISFGYHFGKPHK